MIVYIGFSNKTHKLYAKMLCNKYKHCAPVIIDKNRVVLYQFVHTNKIIDINIRKKDLNILKHYGWTFIKYNVKNIPTDILKIHAITCVAFSKRVCRIDNILIQTPDALFRYLSDK